MAKGGLVHERMVRLWVLARDAHALAHVESDTYGDFASLVRGDEVFVDAFR